jgi:AhpD family alkylhydroperoxidase
MKAFSAFDKAAMAAGAIPVKYKELMALAVAFTTQCPYYIEIHAKKAREAQATQPEISEWL